MMRLIDLSLTNFKGLRDFRLQPDGKDIDVFGDNASGKTTLFDAFLWCLFGKDSLGRSDFEVKTLDEKGQPIPDIDHTVSMVLTIKDKPRTFVRTYREKYTKKRGQSEKELTGHETVYQIDGVPMKEMEYTAAVKSIMPEDVFKLITSARWFNEQLTWQKRRETLIGICGDYADQDVITAEPKLAPLPAILGDYTMAQWRTMVQNKRGDLNKELTALPTRIDEASRAIPAAPEGDLEAVNGELAKWNSTKEQAMRKKATLEAGGAIAEKSKLLRQVETEIIEAQNKGRVQAGRQGQDIRTERDTLLDELGELRDAGLKLVRQGEENTSIIETLMPQLDALRTKWQERNSETWVWDGVDTCPTCHQTLPSGQVDSLKQKAQESFNIDQSNALDAIMQQGKNTRERIETLKAETEKLIAEAKAKGEQLAKVQALVDAKTAEISKLSSPSTPVETAEVKALTAKRDKIEGEIALLRADNSLALQGADDEITQATRAIENLTQVQATFAQRDALEKRLVDLRNRQKELGQQYDQIERGLALSDLFIRTKVRMMETKINSLFQLVRFKLFDVQVNGAVVECCETTVGGVPFGSLNNGMRINAGLDILNALTDYYGVAAPIFIDNAEAVTKLLPTKGQQIRLYVSEPDKTLRIERSA